MLLNEILNAHEMLAVVVGLQATFELVHPVEHVRHLVEDLLDCHRQLQTHAAREQKLEQVIP